MSGILKQYLTHRLPYLFDHCSQQRSNPATDSWNQSCGSGSENLWTWQTFNMSSQRNHHAGSHSRKLDDVEKGLYNSTQSSAVIPLTHTDQRTLIYSESLLSPLSPIHEGITPSSSAPVLSLSCTTGHQPENSTVLDLAAKKPPRPKQKISRWILFQLWFNTYRKFFTFIILLNLTGMIMAALDRFPYAEKHLGALVLGNLLSAILMRSELFLRFLYTIAIYGLRSARSFLYHSQDGC